MSKWEYQVTKHYHVGKECELLCQYGSQGWQISAILPQHNPLGQLVQNHQPDHYLIVWKREVIVS